MSDELVKASHKISFVRSLILFYLSLNVIVLCLLNLRFDILFVGGFFLIAVSFLTGSVAYKEISTHTVLRRRLFLILVFDGALSILAVYVFPFLFVVKFVIGMAFMLLVLSHQLSSTIEPHQ